MKLHVNADGSFEVDISEGEERSAVHLIHELQAVERKKEVSAARSESMKQASVKHESYGELNELQYRTWNYLTDNDNPDGIHVSQVARTFGITVAAANTRLITLHNLGYAKRVHKGYYRALCGPEKESE